ncbi:hypothetical protein RN001_012781 [Aquatica leii]|uniref:DNA replication complex GINS protein PSF1 n=1 Tax=Aquatica leii TaxID=1421715 RepID=A0AAN7SFC1_9COLE|nr:hypothetical protein RN001_012781 [Aquatica leii]
MFGDSAYTLIKELDRNPGTLPPYNNELVGEVKKEICHLVQQNHADSMANDESILGENGTNYFPTIRARHAGVQRNLRCLLAYHYNRVKCLRTMRWEFGSILPPDIKANLSSIETNWFSKYSSMLAKYMRSISEDGGLNLTVDLNPPKALYIEVKCLVDYGQYELSDGSVLLLKENSRHFLPRNECEDLIRQGVFQHIVT